MYIASLVRVHATSEATRILRELDFVFAFDPNSLRRDRAFLVDIKTRMYTVCSNRGFVHDPDVLYPLHLLDSYESRLAYIEGLNKVF